jgi:hypothetical protein
MGLEKRGELTTGMLMSIRITMGFGPSVPAIPAVFVASGDESVEELL